jgi:putative hydrolase of HD superfamily
MRNAPTASLNRGLIEHLYDSASIRRWNDQVRPMEFTELDKQAHKMIIAYVLARFEDEADNRDGIDWLLLIEGGIFEMLHRIILTDIKPPVFHKMMDEKGRELNEYVLLRLEPEIAQVGGDFADRFRRYLFDNDYARREKRVLKAAHFLATQWEFNIIYKVCPFVYGIEKIKTEIEDQIEDHYDLSGVQRLSLGRKTSGFVDMCGQLRFQRRWSQSPRIPETSVLGHMLIVAVLTYLALRDQGAKDHRLVNDFLAALFHDLPEVLTRDITSPVKAAVEGLEDIIKDYEKQQVEERLLPLLPHGWHQQIRYFTEAEFDNRVMLDGDVRTGLTVDQISEQYDEPKYEPIDGEIIRCCDHLAAFIEASLSIQHGITSKHLTEGLDRLMKSYRERQVGKIDFGAIFRAFAPVQ